MGKSRKEILSSGTPNGLRRQIICDQLERLDGIEKMLRESWYGEDCGGRRAGKRRPALNKKKKVRDRHVIPFDGDDDFVSKDDIGNEI